MTDSGIPDGFPEWVSLQRWYGNKGSSPQLERIGGWSVAQDTVLVHTHYLLDHGKDRSVLYQVPLTERAAGLDGVPHIGVADGRFIYDGPTDPAYARAMTRIMLEETAVEGARGHRQEGAPAVEITSAAVLRGEQSNTSVICQVADGSPVILKVFRALHHGDNPDVVLQSAIAGTGSMFVPKSIGSLTGEWVDPSKPGTTGSGHLVFAQEFFPGVEDAWRVALRSAASGDDFSSAASGLGEATAEVHAILATAMPTVAAGQAEIDPMIAQMHARLDAAVLEVASLESCRAPIEAAFEAARTAAWPRLQRIHGDYHLGQVLAVPGRGWVLLDFEGEPMRPMAQRSVPDVTLRDVAGMLRSFDYAAGAAGSGTREDWATSARTAFLTGYAARSAESLGKHRVLLDAFELDKALYEAVYEARNRPGWLNIPVAAIYRLAERSRTGTR